MKSVLVINHGTGTAGMGGIRTRRLLKSLPKHGYRPIVLMSDVNVSKSILNKICCERIIANGLDLPSLWRKYSGSSSLSGAAKPRPASRSTKLTRFLNRWFMIPDKYLPWYFSAVSAARSYLREHPVDIIYATLLPRIDLLVGARLAREFGRPCLMEYRDLWTGSPYAIFDQPTRLHRRIHLSIERRVLRRADRVTVVCNALAEYLNKQHQSVLRHPIEINYNAYDPNEYEGLDRHLGKRFTISYVGAVYGGRSPRNFFQGLRVFIKQAGLSQNDVRFQWLGPIYDLDTIDLYIKEHDLGQCINILGQVSHREALQVLVQSDVSLVLQAPQDTVHIPGKLFEAMGARTPVLMMTNGCEAADIVAATRSGIVCSYEPAEVTAALHAFFQLRQNRRAWQFDEAAVGAYEMSQSIRKFTALLDATLESQYLR